MCQYQGNSIFKGLVTATNEVGEVRLQFHVVSDSHDQAKTPLDAFKQTTAEYGLPQPQIVSTDNPTRDYNFFLNSLESLRDQKAKFDSGLVQRTALSPYPYDANNPFLQIVSNSAAIRLATAAMLTVTNKGKGMALDCEWRVEFNGCGMRTREWEICLIQLVYFNKN